MNNQVEGLQESIAKFRTDIKEAKGKLIPNSDHQFWDQSQLVFKSGTKKKSLNS